ncbi:MAG: pyridoxal-phosphate dependent enzyme, partial [Ignavibacteriales bacterium]
RLQLANIPTPVQQIKFEGTKFLIKRDDYTGTEFSGNKIRKLEYLLYDAQKMEADYIFTCGGEQSNHARATAAASVYCGMKPVLFLWGKEQNNPEGNLFINKFLGAEIIYLSRSEYENVNYIMTEYKKKYEKRGKNVYVIPEGGSSILGIWGYINFINEIIKQVDIKKIKNIYIAAGSGGTAAGLLVGAFLNDLKINVKAVNVLYKKEEIRNKILNLAEGCISEYNLDTEINPENLEIISGYSEEGYKNISPFKNKTYQEICGEYGYNSGSRIYRKSFYCIL